MLLLHLQTTSTTDLLAVFLLCLQTTSINDVWMMQLWKLFLGMKIWKVAIRSLLEKIESDQSCSCTAKLKFFTIIYKKKSKQKMTFVFHWWAFSPTSFTFIDKTWDSKRLQCHQSHPLNWKPPYFVFRTIAWPSIMLPFQAQLFKMSSPLPLDFNKTSVRIAALSTD